MGETIWGWDFIRSVCGTMPVSQPDVDGATRHICQRANQTYMGVVNGGILLELCVYKVHTMKTCTAKNECTSVYKVRTNNTHA